MARPFVLSCGVPQMANSIGELQQYGMSRVVGVVGPGGGKAKGAALPPVGAPYLYIPTTVTTSLGPA